METNEKDKKSTVKKILFYLSLVPYAVFLVWGVVNYILDGRETGYWDAFELIQPLADFWFDTVIVELNPLGIALCLFSLGYPMYYFLDKVGSKKKGKTEDVSEGKAGKSFVLYLVSFVPYLYLVWSVIFGIDFGFFDSYMYYGFEAFVIAFGLGSIIPIYPVILIFQIIYTVKKRRSFSEKNKRLVKGIVISLAALILIPSLIYLVAEKREIKKTTEADRVIIEKYLKETYGERHFAEMEIGEKDYVSVYYGVSTPLLKESLLSLELDESHTRVIKDDFKESLIAEKRLEEKLGDRLAKEYGLPEKVELDMKIHSINLDIKEYDGEFDVESLLDECEYEIKSIAIRTGSVEKRAVTKTLSDFYVNYSELLEDHYSGERVVFQLKSVQEDFFRVDMLRPTPEKNYLTIIFWSLDNEEVYVDLSDK